jgi:hypothetical protein
MSQVGGCARSSAESGVGRPRLLEKSRQGSILPKDNGRQDLHIIPQASDIGHNTLQLTRQEVQVDGFRRVHIFS